MTWQSRQPPHVIEVERSDLEASPETWQANLGMLTERSRYGGTVWLPGKKMGRDLRMAWSTFVPKGMRIERVSHFDGGYVLTHPGEDMTLTLAGDMRTLRTYTLHDNDALVVRQKDGKIFTLYHPFYVPEASAQELVARTDSDAYPAVEVLGLCRLANYIPLKEKARLDGAYGEPLQAVVSQLLEVQKQQRYGRLGRIVAERVVLFRDVLPTVLVSGFVLPVEVMDRLRTVIPLESWQTTVGAVALGLGMYAGAHSMAKRCVLPRPPIAADPTSAAE